mgnify:CR=1 FL=1
MNSTGIELIGSLFHHCKGDPAGLPLLPDAFAVLIPGAQILIYCRAYPIAFRDVLRIRLCGDLLFDAVRQGNTDTAHDVIIPSDRG